MLHPVWGLSRGEIHTNKVSLRPPRMVKAVVARLREGAGGPGLAQPSGCRAPTIDCPHLVGGGLLDL